MVQYYDITVLLIDEVNMKFLSLVFSLVVLTSVAFAGDIPIKVNDSISVSKSVVPDTMSAGISATASTKTFADAVAQMERVASVIKNHEICSYNSYNVAPMYHYNDSKRVKDGFSGSISTQCKFTDVHLYNAVVRDANAIANKSLTLSISPIRWILTPETVLDVKNSLKSDLISQIENTASAFSAATKKNCMLSVVTFAGANNYYESPAPMRTAAKLNVSAPDKNSRSISVDAEYTLICK